MSVNSDDRIAQYHERVNQEQQDRQERNLLSRQVDTLVKQLQELRGAMTLLQLQWNEAQKGRARPVRDSGTPSPPVTKNTTDKPSSSENDGDVQRIVMPRPALSAPLPASSSLRIMPLAGLDDRPNPVPRHASEEADTAWQAPVVVELGKREAMEIHNTAIIFRVSHDTGRSDFQPSVALTPYLKKALTKAIMAGHCIQVRGYTDGDHETPAERRVALQRAEKARAYLIEHGFARLNIDVKVYPAGEHITENATEAGRAKNRRVEIELMDLDPAGVWPQWNREGGHR